MQISRLKSIRTAVTTVLVLGFVALAFQNCGGSKDETDDTTVLNTNPDSVTVANCSHTDTATNAVDITAKVAKVGDDYLASIIEGSGTSASSIPVTVTIPNNTVVYTGTSFELTTPISEVGAGVLSYNSNSYSVDCQ